MKAKAVIQARHIYSYTHSPKQVTFTTHAVGGLQSATGHLVDVTLQSADVAFLLEGIVSAFGAANVIATVKAIEAKAGKPGRIMTTELEGEGT
jgi:hypothetical protein